MGMGGESENDRKDKKNKNKKKISKRGSDNGRVMTNPYVL